MGAFSSYFFAVIQDKYKKEDKMLEFIKDVWMWNKEGFVAFLLLGFLFAAGNESFHLIKRLFKKTTNKYLKKTILEITEEHKSDSDK